MLVESVRYYVAGHTAKGYVNFISSNLKGINQRITLNHPCNLLKTRIIQEFINDFSSDYEVEIILSAHGREYLEGLVIPEKSLSIITNAILEDGLNSESFNLAKFVPISGNSQKMEQSVLSYFKEAYSHFENALSIHDQLEAVYINEMDFEKADQLAAKFIENTLGDFRSKNKKSVKKRRLFGTNTYEGAVNIVPELLKRVKSRFYLKGRAGTGKSTFMRAVIKKCEELGLDMEIYHCSFDPNSVDMVLVPEADFCIFDSTAPHEFFPENNQDMIIDLYEKTVTPGTDEKFATEIEKITNNYKNEIKNAVNSIKKAREKQVEIEREYSFSRETVKKIANNLLAAMKK